MCNFKIVQGHAQWLRSPEGRFAFTQKRRMIENLLSGWPRRGHSVLEIGCGVGLYLELLWEAGLDPTGIEDSPELLDSVRKHMGSKVDLHLGKLESLPFEDEEFDYVALLSTLDYTNNVQAVLNEAFRVASKGLLISFNNSCSLAALGKALNKGPDYTKQLNYHCPPKIFSLLRSITGKTSCTFRTTLLGPPNIWRENAPLSFINRAVSILPFGAYAGVRIDLEPPPTGTLLPLSIGSPDPV